MFWYEDEVRRLEKERAKVGVDAETIFYGSSTLRLWASLYDDLNQLKPVNLGFGGSTLAACDWFFERVMEPYHPKRIVIYAGDNDLGDGRHPEEIFIFFQQLVVKIEKRFGNLPCYFISLKPSPHRWHLADQFKYTNNLIENEIVKWDGNWRFINVFKQMLDPTGKPRPELFDTDGLHLSKKGYELWKDVVSKSVTLNQ